MVCAVGVIASAILFFLGKPILRLMGVTSALLVHGVAYMGIVGGMMFMQPVLNISAVIMRTHGYSTETLGITAGMNILNVAADIILVFGFSMGTAGAAWATAMSRFFAMLMALGFVLKNILD